MLSSPVVHVLAADPPLSTAEPAMAGSTMTPVSMPVGPQPIPVTAPPSPRRAPGAAKQATARFIDRRLPGTGVRLVATLVLVVAIAGGFFVAVVGRELLGGEPADLRTLMVRSTPRAAVVLDGERIGTTPLVEDLRLADGAHRLEIAVQDGPRAERKLSLTKGDRFLVVSENLLAAGKLTIDTRPQGARLFLDGAEVGRSPLVLEKVSTDKTHVVEARLQGYATQTATVPVDRGAAHEMVLTLPSTEEDGRVVIHSHPPADVWIDGKPWGRTSQKPRDCPAGVHDVALQVPGLPGQRSYTIEVPEQGIARYFFDLKPSAH